MTANELHVIFGSGALGKSVMRELVRQGKRVRMVNRSGSAQAPAGVEVARADVYDAASARDAAKGATVVYQCAQPAYTQWVEKFPPLQANIMEAAIAHDAKFIVGDNLYMYGEIAMPMTEDSPNLTTTKKGRTRAAMADAVLEAHRLGRVRAAIARGSDYYGQDALASSMGERVFYPALAGKAAQVAGNIDLPHTYTYIDDFGRALVMLGARDEALGEIWHVPSGPTRTTREFLKMIYEEAGQPLRVSAMSKLMMRVGGLFIPEAREIVEIMYQFDQPFVMNSSKFARVFGDISTPHEDAIRATVDWYRQRPADKQK